MDTIELRKHVVEMYRSRIAISIRRITEELGLPYATVGLNMLQPCVLVVNNQVHIEAEFNESSLILAESDVRKYEKSLAYRSLLDTAFRQDAHVGNNMTIEYEGKRRSGQITYIGIQRDSRKVIFAHTFGDPYPAYQDLDEYKAFITAICSTPADNLPRMVLADWLDEHGDGERAEFIRLTIENQQDFDADRLAVRSWNGVDPVPKWTGKAARIMDWCQENSRKLANWSIPGLNLTTFAGDYYMTQRNISGNIGVEWSRGFISSVSFTLAQFEEHAAKIAAIHPVQCWTLTDIEPQIEMSGYLNRTGTVSYMWNRADDDPGRRMTTEFARSDLPIEIFDDLDGELDRVWRSYESRDIAIKALQKSLNRIARRRAGLPALD